MEIKCTVTRDNIQLKALEITTTAVIAVVAVMVTIMVTSIYRTALQCLHRMHLTPPVLLHPTHHHHLHHHHLHLHLSDEPLLI